MGRIKTKQTKRLTRELMKRSDNISIEFNTNKKIIDDIAPSTTKKMRNVIAGYAARLRKEQKAQEV